MPAFLPLVGAFVTRRVRGPAPGTRSRPRCNSRHMRVLVLAAVVCAVLAAPAAAKVWFLDMRGETVRWGQRVTTTISGCPGNPSCGGVVRELRVWMRRVHGGHGF